MITNLLMHSEKQDLETFRKHYHGPENVGPSITEGVFPMPVDEELKLKALANSYRAIRGEPSQLSAAEVMQNRIDFPDFYDKDTVDTVWQNTVATTTQVSNNGRYLLFNDETEHAVNIDSSKFTHDVLVALAQGDKALAAEYMGRVNEERQRLANYGVVVPRFGRDKFYTRFHGVSGPSNDTPILDESVVHLSKTVAPSLGNISRPNDSYGVIKK